MPIPSFAHGVGIGLKGRPHHNDYPFSVAAALVKPFLDKGITLGRISVAAGLGYSYLPSQRRKDSTNDRTILALKDLIAHPERADRIAHINPRGILAQKTRPARPVGRPRIVREVPIITAGLSFTLSREEVIDLLRVEVRNPGTLNAALVTKLQQALLAAVLS